LQSEYSGNRAGIAINPNPFLVVILDESFDLIQQNIFMGLFIVEWAQLKMKYIRAGGADTTMWRYIWYE